MSFGLFLRGIDCLLELDEGTDSAVPYNRTENACLVTGRRLRSTGQGYDCSNLMHNISLAHVKFREAAALIIVLQCKCSVFTYSTNCWMDLHEFGPMYAGLIKEYVLVILI